MADEFRELFAIKDTKSGRYLNNIWLAQEPKDITLFMSLESAKNHLSKIRMGHFVPNGGTGFYAKDLVIVRLEVTPIEEI
jgi:hypothetical protein